MTETPPNDDVQDTAQRLLEAVRALAAELNPKRGETLNVTLDSRLDRDLGIDSLGRVELLARLEAAFAVTISEYALMEAETPRDLLRALAVARGRHAVATLPPEAEALSLGLVVNTPTAAQTLVEVLAWHNDRHPDRPHIRLYSDATAGDVITYGELYDGAGQVAQGLQGLGVSRGEAVVIMLPTGRDYFLTFFGVLLAGGVPVPVYPPGRLSELEEHLLRHVAIVGNCRARVMVVMDEVRRFAQLLRARAPGLAHVVAPGDLGRAGDAPFRAPRVVQTDTALLQYTSGSTGSPKGVVLTHANLLANIRAMGRALKATSDDVFVSWLPLYHDMGLIGAWLGSLYHATPLVVMSPLAFIARPIRWLKAIHRFGGTLSAAPNFAYELCLRRIADEDLEGLDLSTWRQALNGAETVSPATVEHFIARFAANGFRAEALMPVYGLAECTVGLAFPPLNRAPLIERIRRKALMAHGHAEPADPGDDTALRFPSCGVPLPGHFIRIADAAGHELPERIEGRVEFRGPSATSGYLHAPDKTRELFDRNWLDSGDMGYIAAGELYITGRAKDIIIRAGRNIYPEEVEEAISRIDGIRPGGVAVFASLDERSGTERLIVLAETRKRDPAVQDAQRGAVNAIVTDLTGTPADDVALTPPNTVPKTSSGKVRRAASRDIYERGQIGEAGRISSRPAVWWQLARYTLGAVRPHLARTWRAVLGRLYAAYCWVVAGVVALPLWMVLVVTPHFNWRWAVARTALRAVAKLCGISFSVRGAGHLMPGGVPAVVVTNHQSYLDALVLIALLPRPVSFVAKSELKSNFFVRLLLARFQTEYVERFDMARGAAGAKLLSDVARGGRTLVFFAEGTFTRTPGLLPFRLGAFETACAAGLNVVPVAIRGTRSALRGSQWFMRRVAVSVTLGAPIAPRGTDFNAQLDLRHRTRAWILAHAGEPDLGGEVAPVPGTVED